MRDILGRKYYLGDLVVYNNTFYLVVGEDSLYNNSVVKTEDTIYRVEAPNAQEQEFKQRLQASYNLHMKKVLEEKDKKKKEYALNKKASVNIVRGDIVKNKYYHYLYLGEVSYVDFEGAAKQGHMYAYLSSEKIKDITQLDCNTVSMKSLVGWPDRYVANEEDIPVEGNKILKDRLKVYKGKVASMSNKVKHVDVIGNKLMLNALFTSWKRDRFTDKRCDYTRSIEFILL